MSAQKVFARTLQDIGWISGSGFLGLNFYRIPTSELPFFSQCSGLAGGYKKKADHENDARTQEVADFAVSEV